MLQLTIAQLARIYPAATRANIEKALPSLNDTLRAYKIDTIRRVSCFLGQLGVESGELRYTRELWGPTAVQKRYEGRKDLGNTQPGDGYRFRGRGLIQTTGRFNYAKVSKALGYDFLADPDALGTYPYAALSAGYFWDSHKLNFNADYLQVEAITKTVNGGYTALDERIDYTNNALAVLGEDVRVEKKKWVPFLVGASVVLALIVVLYNYSTIQSWIKKQKNWSITSAY